MGGKSSGSIYGLGQLFHVHIAFLKLCSDEKSLFESNPKSPQRQLGTWRRTKAREARACVFYNRRRAESCRQFCKYVLNKGKPCACARVKQNISYIIAWIYISNRKYMTNGVIRMLPFLFFFVWTPVPAKPLFRPTAFSTLPGKTYIFKFCRFFFYYKKTTKIDWLPKSADASVPRCFS